MVSCGWERGAEEWTSYSLPKIPGFREDGPWPEDGHCASPPWVGPPHWLSSGKRTRGRRTWARQRTPAFALDPSCARRLSREAQGTRASPSSRVRRTASHSTRGCTEGKRRSFASLPRTRFRAARTVRLEGCQLRGRPRLHRQMSRSGCLEPVRARRKEGASVRDRPRLHAQLAITRVGV